MEKQSTTMMKTIRYVVLATLLLLANTLVCAQSNPEWFTVVLFGDPEYGMGGADRADNQATRENGIKWVNAIINMHTSGRFRFRNQPAGFVPKADLVICMGDIDGDSKRGRTDSEDIFDLFVNAGVPFFALLGNHDVVPDYWNGGDKGVTWGSSGGQAANEHSFNESAWYRNDARNKGYVQNMKIYRHGQGEWQIEPFAFTFKGVRFYMGQTYWFQKPYNAPATIFNSATYYAPNDILRDLTNDVIADNKATPAIWVQHYPIDAADRWWTDTNANGAFIGTQNTPDYSTANDKRNKYKDLISRTKNPHHFSGHQHWTYTSTYTANGTTFKDHIAPYHATNGGAFIVLCNSRDGVVEVKTVEFGADSYPNNVFALSDLSNTKIYTITTEPNNVNRGALVYDQSKGNYVCAQNVATNPTNPNHQWAILSANNSYYLYNVAAKKFATANGNKLTLTDTPTNDSKVEIVFHNGKESYPWLLKMKGQYLNVNIGSFTPEGLRVGTWSYIDDGNQYSIAEVGDFADMHEALSLLLYPVNNAARGNSTHASRYVNKVMLRDESTGVQSQISGLQTAPGQKVYWDKTDKSFVVNAGAMIKTNPEYTNMSGLQTYVFVDEDGDGFSNDVDAANHCALEGSDLKTWSAYRFGNQNGNWYNSTGNTVNQNATSLPTFKAPMRPGNYRMRYVVAWDTVDPQGNATIASDGGIIVDVTLKVVPAAITSLDQIRNDVVYTIRTNVRGNLRHEGDNPHATAKIADYDATDEGQQWAIIKKDGKTYLYNVHAKTMARRGDDKKMYMVDPPTPDSWIDIIRSNSDDYPWTIKFGSRFLNTTTGSEWGYLVDNGNNGNFDDGNRYLISAVGDLSSDDAQRIEYLLRYSVRENAYNNSTSGNRYTRGIKLNGGNAGTQTINGLQTGYRQQVYFDKTDQKFTCVRGSMLTPEFNFGAMNAMQCCVFVDEDGQGFSSNYDAVNHRTQPNSDLKTWSGLKINGKWYNSLGEETNSECRTLPAFKAPSTPGTYRMRYMVAWNSVEPRGYAEINENGGIIVDVTLEVVDNMPLTDLANLTPNCVYTLSTHTRGNLYYDSSRGNYVNALNTKEYNANDNNQRWALIPKGDKLYLYNMAARKYAKKGTWPSGAGGYDLVLTDTPDANSEVTIALTNNNNSDYPWYIKLGGSYVNASTSYGTWAPHGVYASGWGGSGSWDDGNQFAIVAVDGFTAQDLASLRTAATAAKADLNQRGVGYPTTTCPEYAALQRAIADIEHATSASNDIVLRSNLETALKAYQTTNNIELPQTGKYYTIKLVGYNNGDYHLNLASKQGAEDGIVASQTLEPTPFLAINNGDGTFRLVTYTGKYFRVITDYSDVADRSSTGLSDGYSAILNNLTLKANDYSFRPLGGVRIVGAGGTGGKICSLIFGQSGSLGHYGDLATGVDPGWTNTTVWTEVPAPATRTTTSRGTSMVVKGLEASRAEVYANDVKEDNVTVTTNGGNTIISMPAKDEATTYTIFVEGAKGTEPETSSQPTGVGARMYTYNVGRATTVSVTFVNYVTGRQVVKDVQTCVGTPLSTILLAEFPNSIMIEQSHEAIQSDVEEYTITFGPNYELDLPNNTHSTNQTNSVSLSVGGRTAQTIEVNQTTTGPTYIDKSDYEFYCTPGATLAPSIGFASSWMHGYVYLDENKDGFMVADADIVDNVLQADPEIDLRSFTYYQGRNSAGISRGQACGASNLPTFTAPLTPGTYRLRYKIDWNSIDPNGNPGNSVGKNKIENNGGSIVDVTLVVVGPEVAVMGGKVSNTVRMYLDADAFDALLTGNDEAVENYNQNKEGNVLGFLPNKVYRIVGSTGSKAAHVAEGSTRDVVRLADYDADDDTFKWMIYPVDAANNKYVLYNIGKQKLVATERSGGAGYSDAWYCFQNYAEVYGSGYYAATPLGHGFTTIDQLEANVTANPYLWCLSDSHTDNAGAYWGYSEERNSVRNYAHDRDDAQWHIEYIGDATDEQIADLAYAVEAVKENKIDVTVKNGWGYASLYSEKLNLKIPDGCMAYTFVFEERNDHTIVSARRIMGDYVPAGTGVILKGDAGVKDFCATVLRSVNEVEEGNLLRGTDEQQLVEVEDDGILYFLSKGSMGVGFYQASQNGKSFTNGAHKAYMELPVESEAAMTRMFLFSSLFDNETGIDEAPNDKSSETYYDLSGRRLSKRPKSGLYIINGRKNAVK